MTEPYALSKIFSVNRMTRFVSRLARLRLQINDPPYIKRSRSPESSNPTPSSNIIMSLTYTSFVVAGAGGLGALITSELLSIGGTKVTVFTRGGNSKIPSGATERVVDYTKPDELEKALKDTGAQVVVSTLSGPGLALQIGLADAAQKAGVKLFVPSEFGSKSHEAPSLGLFDLKKNTVKHLKEIGLPYTVFYTGLFADLPLYVFPSLLNLENRTVTVVGSGTVKLSVVTRPDIARFVAHALTHTPHAQLENTIIGIESEKVTWYEIAKVYEKKYGAPFEVKLRDADQVKKEVDEKGAVAFLDYILWGIEQGYGNVGDYKKVELFPDWNPLSFEAAVQKYYP
ncbi:NAD(P)-binding protein [Exidia glandulosa HHB12029]|uniref:NAD(P)-binding protein n=1 Tax=Exidia glandulosa HHB12029 TaxID=1314781 RepID=A0A166BND1_EXIGL|nr:NAD(P)-binding protein [Exidia glandulosa HHB12029]